MKLELNHQKSFRGLTLMELMVAMAIASIILITAAKLTMFTARSFVALANYNELDQASQIALDTMTREIRASTNCTKYTAKQIIFDNGRISYTWNPVTRQLTATNNGVAKILLRQCDALTFRAFQRNPTNNFSFVEATNLLNTIKLVDVSWKCSRMILQEKVNTESVQTAKIVMRN